MAFQICPIMSHRDTAIKYCAGFKCAWWNSDKGSCCIRAIAEASVNLNECATSKKAIYVKEV